MDQLDYFIEKCKNGKCLYEGEYKDVIKLEENIYFKNKTSRNYDLYQTTNGILEIPYDEEDNFFNTDNEIYFLSKRDVTFDGIENLVKNSANFFNLKDIDEAMKFVSAYELTSNFLLSDSKGNICYQQTGKSPVRKYSGLFPVIGWKSENSWKGYVNISKFNSFCNPKEGFIATANNDMDNKKEKGTINLCLGDYRTKRIKELLSKDKKYTTEDMKEIQFGSF
jgi:penicillin G amidase